MHLATLEKSLTGIDTRTHGLWRVNSFEIGEYYRIHMVGGKVLDVRNLDTLLEVVETEFLAAETYDAVVKMGKKNRGKAPLFLYPKPVLGIPWNRNVTKLCTQLRDWMIFYNLNDCVWPDEVVEKSVWT